MTRLSEFQRQHPDVFVVDGTDRPGLTAYLRARRWIEADEDVHAAERAGDGNMNCTLRVETARRTVIIKQARPWVEKYDHIPAPWDRALVEARFYRRIADVPHVQARMPRLLGVDESSRILLLEDLGHSRDLTTIYGGDPLDHDELDALVDYLAALHAITVASDERLGFANRAMRRLNHEYIFHLPLSADNPVDLDGLTPGLAAIAASLRRDDPYCRMVSRIGEEYLADGDVLLHGDFFPGSWLRTDRGMAVIDPEFCYVGDAGVDLGVFIAHLVIARQPRAGIERVIARYRQARAVPAPATAGWLRVAGVEIMRRLIGVAQLPLEAGIERKRDLLERSRRLVVAPDLEALGD